MLIVGKPRLFSSTLLDTKSIASRGEMAKHVAEDWSNSVETVRAALKANFFVADDAESE